MHVAWLATAGAVLSKGLVGLVIPGGTLVLYSLFQRDWKLWRRLHIATGLLLFLAVAAPWFVLVTVRNPEFAWFFFVHEHLLRYTTEIHQRIEPWYYFLPLAIAGGLPWTVTMVGALWRACRADPEQRFQSLRFLAIWAIFVLVFFSASGSKLPPYILPLFPALALLSAVYVSRLPGPLLGWQLAPVAVLALAALIALPFVHSSGDTPPELIESFKLWLVAGALVILLGLGFAIWFARSQRVDLAVLTAAFSALLAVQLMLTGHEAVSPSMSAYRLAAAVKPYLKPGVPFYSVAMYDQTLDFYLGRTVTLVEFRDELDFGLQQQPELAIASVGEWMTLWRGQTDAFAIMEKVNYDSLSRHIPMQVIAHDQRRYLVKKP
jgi:4-amino-4-deoxy-L-arabinose transferase-like glycosyltransferase